MPKEIRKSKTAGDMQIDRWTDKSNSYEKLDPSENEKPNSVFPSKGGKKKTVIKSLQ